MHVLNLETIPLNTAMLLLVILRSPSNKKTDGAMPTVLKKLNFLSAGFPNFHEKLPVFTFKEFNINEFQRCPNFLHLIQRHTIHPLKIFYTTIIIQKFQKLNYLYLNK